MQFSARDIGIRDGRAAVVIKTAYMNSGSDATVDKTKRAVETLFYLCRIYWIGAAFLSNLYMKSLYRRRFFHLASLCHFAHLSEIIAHSDRSHLRRVMLFNPKRQEHLGRLEEHLRCAQAITPELISDVIAQACTRFPAHSRTVKDKVNRLIESGAWTDAVLALVELELPQWKLRRIVYEDSEWLCSLSRQPQLPPELDEVAEASHEIMPLAILIALLLARRSTAVSATGMATVPQVRSVPGYAMCCENLG